MSDQATTLGELADREAIRQQIYNYCRAVDRMDADLGYKVWHEDGTADYGEDVYQGTGRGFIDHVNAVHAHLLAHSHQVTNIIIHLDGDRAASESYHVAYLTMDRGGQLMEMRVCGRYLDKWSRRNGLWAIDHRTTVRDIDSIQPITALSKCEVGSRDATDPSYRFLGSGA
ncbi:nuclear transport factor 2 family protein [Erythrobacter alti]|uniref:nuclear transport factor 2 family protein n=1 Tax=Erythrobacter alti TaxID=1896145 RepID=UPI0030F3FC70